MKLKIYFLNYRQQMIKKNKTVQVPISGRNDRKKKLEENQSESMNHIYSLLNRQQYTIQNLLNKYKDNDMNISHNDTFQPHSSILNDGSLQRQLKSKSHTVELGTLSKSRIKLKLLLNKDQRADSKPFTRQTSIDSRIKSDKQYQTYREKKEYPRQNESISLPIINQKLPKNGKKNGKDKNELLYNFRKERLKMQNQLYKIYGEKNSYFINQSRWQIKSSLTDPITKPKKQKNKKRSLKKKQRINQVQIRESSSNQKANQKDSNGIQVESDDDSEEQVSVVYYQRQFRDLMRTQLSEELNFLYFSKNEKLKDWTDSLLSMIQKHDKQITGIRKKSKYLEKFDDNFFSVGIFNSNDL